MPSAANATTEPAGTLDPAAAAQLLSLAAASLSTNFPEMLDTRAAAKLLGVAAASLEVDRCRHRWRIPYVKFGGRVLYRRGDLLAFLDRHRVEG